MIKQFEPEVLTGIPNETLGTSKKPYKHNRFDFGDPEFKNSIRHYTREAPLSNEPRGSKHFIYTTRVHLGLYNLLMKLEAEIDVTSSKKILSEMLEMEF